MYFDEIELHMTQKTRPVTITKEQIFAFGKIYDPLPLHTDETYAKNSRFGALIAPGVMSFMLVWAEYLSAVQCLGQKSLIQESIQLSLQDLTLSFHI
jgi:acyl dehydratase